MASITFNIKALLNIALWILITDVKVSTAEHYSNLQYSPNKQTSNKGRPLILLLDNKPNSNNRHWNNLENVAENNWNDGPHRVDGNDWDKKSFVNSHRYDEENWNHKASSNLHKIDGNDWDNMALSNLNRVAEHDRDNRANSALDKNDVPYLFLYLYKLAQQVRNNYGRNTKHKQNTRGSYFSSVGTNKRPNWSNKKIDHRYGNRNEHNVDHYVENYNRYDYNNDGYNSNSINNNEVDKNLNRNNIYRNRYWINHDSTSRNKGRDYSNFNKNENKRNYRNTDKAYRNSVKNLLWNRNFNNFVNNNRGKNYKSKRVPDNNNKYSGHKYRPHGSNKWSPNKYWSQDNNGRYPNRYHIDFGEDSYQEWNIDNKINKLTNKNKEIIQLDNNLLESPFIKTLLRISNDLTLRQKKDSCESGDTCAEDNAPVVTDDPCEGESNSCELEESTNISTRGAVQDHVSDPPPQMC